MNVTYIIKEFQNATNELKKATEAIKEATEAMKPKKPGRPKSVTVEPKQGAISG